MFQSSKHRRRRADEILDPIVARDDYEKPADKRAATPPSNLLASLQSQGIAFISTACSCIEPATPCATRTASTTGTATSSVTATTNVVKITTISVVSTTTIYTAATTVTSVQATTTVNVATTTTTSITATVTNCLANCQNGCYYGMSQILHSMPEVLIPSLFSTSPYMSPQSSH